MKERRAGRWETKDMASAGQSAAGEQRLLHFPLCSFRFTRRFPDNINFSALRTIGLTILGCGLIESLIDLLRGECMCPPFG
jgi:hypothetical protein